MSKKKQSEYIFPLTWAIIPLVNMENTTCQGQFILADLQIYTTVIRNAY